jgi:hypothetical protein
MMVHPLQERTGGAAGEERQDYDFDLEMFEQMAFILVDGVEGVITAFDVNIGADCLEKGAGVEFGENMNGIDGSKRRQNPGAIAFVVEGPSRAFEDAHAGIAGQANEEGVALAAGLTQIGDVSEMENVETAVGHDQFPAVSL